jgi:CDP-diacylglycerol--glycerol-3-phosphate 3-phosphatidyltransferase
VILAREVGITALRVFVIRHGVIPASRGGKLKTLVQNISIGLYLLPLTGGFASARFWVMAVAIVFTVLTGADYVSKAVTVRRTSERTAMKRLRRLQRR